MGLFNKVFGNNNLQKTAEMLDEDHYWQFFSPLSLPIYVGTCGFKVSIKNRFVYP